MPLDSDDAAKPAAGALDRPLALTLFGSAAAREKVERTYSLRRIGQGIGRKVSTAKGKLPWLKLATFGDKPSPNGSLRYDKNVLSVDGVEGDYDSKGDYVGEIVSRGEASKRMRAAGLAAVLYDTASNTDARPCWRVLVPTSRALPPAERRRLCDLLNAALGGILARESFTLSQSYYFGGVGNAVGVTFVEGRFIDDAKDAAPAVVDNDEAGDDDDPFRDYLPEPDLDLTREAAEKMPNDGPAEWNDWKKRLMAFYAVGSEDAREHAEAWSRKHHAHDDRVFDEAWRRIIASPPDRIGAGFLRSEIRNAEDSAPSGIFNAYAMGSWSPDRGREPIWQDRIARRDVGVVVAQTHVGKTAFIAHILTCLAHGKAAFGRPVLRCRVVWFAAEDESSAHDRMEALRIEHGHTDRFHLVVVAAGQSFSLLHNDDVTRLIELLNCLGADVVAIDTFSAAAPGQKESDVDVASMTLKRLRRIPAEVGCTVILAHHAAKADRSEEMTSRGSGDFDANFDFRFVLLRGENDGEVRVTLSKNRNGAKQVFGFSLGTRTLPARDSWGKPRSALIVVGETEKPSAPLTPAGKRVLAALNSLGGTAPVSSLHEAAVKASPLKAPDRDWQRGFQELREKGVVTVSAEGIVSGTTTADPWPDDNEATNS